MYKRKTVDVWDIQGMFVEGEWETVVTEYSRREAVEMHKCYCENDVDHRYRIKSRREKIGDESH